jgi:hypothetical protein
MHRDRFSLRPRKSVLLRSSAIVIVLASLTSLALSTVTTLSEKAKTDRAERYAKNLTSLTVSSVDDLAAFFKRQQAIYLLITPPSPNFVRRQPCGVIPFDPKGFPTEFLKGLIEETDNECPVYRLVLAEASKTRETVCANAMAYEIYAVGAAKDYDLWGFLNWFHPDLYSGRYTSAQIEWLKECYDPANVQIAITLLPAKYIDAYAAGLADAYVAPSGGGMAMMRYSGPPVTNIQVAVETQTNGMLVTVVYPDEFTNRVDVYACTNLLDAWWDLGVTTNVNLSTNWIEWLDTFLLEHRFYAAGNADVDTDADGLPDAREKFMYHTNPSNADSDNDGMADGWEVSYGFNPLDASDAGGDADLDGLSNWMEYVIGSGPRIGHATTSLTTLGVTFYQPDVL